MQMRRPNNAIIQYVILVHVIRVKLLHQIFVNRADKKNEFWNRYNKKSIESSVQ